MTSVNAGWPFVVTVDDPGGFLGIKIHASLHSLLREDYVNNLLPLIGSIDNRNGDGFGEGQRRNK